MRSKECVLAGLLALGLGGACGGNSSGGPSGDGGPRNDSGGPSLPLADLPPKLAQAMCAAFQNCYGPLFDLFLNGVDCVAVTEQRIRNSAFPLFQGEIDQGRIVYDGTKAQACLDELLARTCATMLDRDSDACLAALDGTVALGGACTLDEDCKGQAICKSSSGTCPGQCVPLLVAGQPCDQDSDCQSGLQCSSETKLCVVPATDGQPCEYTAPPCGPGLLCLGKDDTKKTPGTCRTIAAALSVPAGAACDATNSTLCQPGSSCIADGFDLASVSISWLCVPTGSYPPGGSCKPGFPEACASGYYCQTGSGLAVLTGTCAVSPAAGQPCAGSINTQCQPGVVCVYGTCQNLAANGVSCTGDAMCYSEKCGTSGGCEAKLPCK